VTPCTIASKAEVDSAFYLKLVGFGYTNLALRDFGIKNKVDVIVASTSCDNQSAQQRYGCNADVEIVAGGNGVDTCNGDSGGPAYVLVGGVAKVAGVTSRATRNSSVPCGDGGNYSRADRYIQEGDPLFQQAKAKGAIFE
jgi:endonuclease G